MPEVMVIEEGSEVATLAQALLDAAIAYKAATRNLRFSGAVQWLDASDGFTVILTRGEYRHTLMENIHKLDPEAAIATFAHATTEPDMEAEFERRTPDGLTG